ncbi:Myb/SANT-like domain-containing protein [Tanacetum coccineum]
MEVMSYCTLDTISRRVLEGQSRVCFYITMVGVTKRFRRRGVASELLREAFSFARGRGLEKAYLHVEENNMSAIRCYETNGFTVWPSSFYTSVQSRHGADVERLVSRGAQDGYDSGLQSMIRYLLANGRTSPFKWVELQPEFEKVVKTELYSYKVLKNKYDEMRKDYSLWSSLKNGETGLGWNATTMTLSCSDEWWDKKIKENKRVRSFRKKQPTKELQEAWYNLFGDAVANGVECVAPCMNPSTLNGVHNVDEEDVEAVDVEEDGDPKKSAKISSKPVPMKRKGRESAGKALFKEMMKEQKDMQTRVFFFMP